MPQPYKGSGWKSGMDALKARPKLAAHIGTIAAMWSQIELQLGILLALILQADAQIATAMYMRLKSETVRLAAIEAVAEEKLTDDLLEEYNTLGEKIRKTGSQRDTIMHGLWAIPDDNPESLVLIDPREFVTWASRAIGAHAKRSEGRGAGRAYIHRTAPFESALEYKESDFIDIQNRISELLKEIYKFSAKVPRI